MNNDQYIFYDYASGRLLAIGTKDQIGKLALDYMKKLNLYIQAMQERKQQNENMNLTF